MTVRLALAGLGIAAGVAGTAFAIGNGNVIATPPVTFITTATGTGTANAVLQNTSTGGFTVELARDPACDPELDFSVAGGSPFTLAGLAQKTITFDCTTAHLGLERCLVHAIDANTREPLADVMAVCERATATTLSPATTTLDFGTVQVGDTVALPLGLTNNGGAAIGKLFFQTDELDDNFEIALPCNPDAPACDGAVPGIANGATTTAVVHCAPRSPGLHTAHLHVATDTGLRLATPVTLTCTGAAATTPVLGVAPPVVAIAVPTEVLSTVVHSTAYLSNLGTGSLLISDLRPVDVDPSASFDWTFTLGGTCTSVPCTLAPGEQVVIDLAFDPSQIATRRASLLVTFTDTIARTRSISLLGTGRGATLQLAATPTTIDLGSVPLGRSTSATLHFANTGNRDTTAMLGLAPVGPYTLAPAAMLAVTPTAIADLVATCTPAAAGSAGTTISATSSDTITMVSLSVAATCLGTTTLLYTTPTAIDLGEIRLDSGPTTRVLDLLSNGAPLTISGTPHLQTANANLVVGTPSVATTPATLDLTVLPQTEGDLSSHLVIDDTAGDSLIVPITGRLVTASYSVPTVLDVGTFCVGQPTTSSNLALTNDGTATIALAAPGAPQTSGFDIGLTAPTLYPATLPSSKTATISVTPQRQLTAAVPTLTTVVTWTTDVAARPTASTMVTAHFVDSGGAIAPQHLDFGVVPVHLYLDDGQRVMIQNCNGSVLELDPPTIKAPFTIDSPAFPTQLEPNETATFTVGFHPTRPGVYSDTLAISSPQLATGPLVVTLAGSTAVVMPGTDAGSAVAELPSTTFYACSCGTGSDPRGAAPIVLALALVIVRRRAGSS